MGGIVLQGPGSKLGGVCSRGRGSRTSPILISTVGPERPRLWTTGLGRCSLGESRPSPVTPSSLPPDTGAGPEGSPTRPLLRGTSPACSRPRPPSTCNPERTGSALLGPGSVSVGRSRSLAPLGSPVPVGAESVTVRVLSRLAGVAPTSGRSLYVPFVPSVLGSPPPARVGFGGQGIIPQGPRPELSSGVGFT